jgi:RNA polymerase sigma factor (sigma-70 family)
MSSDPQAQTTTNKNWAMTQESFDRLLRWLNPEREAAGMKYEDIRRRLIKFFTCRGCREAEDLADETINRVARRLAEIAETYRGDPAPYFYGVAQKVYLEYLRRRPAPKSPPPAPPAPEEEEPEYECLERCMQRLPEESRDLVLQYYQEEKGVRIDHRRRLADRLGIALNALRIRVYRIRAGLQECVRDCLERQAG